jgi:hypothetical protein
MRLNILYVADLSHGATSRHRLWALQRLGCRVTALDSWSYLYGGTPWARRLRLRLQLGPGVRRFNDAVLDHAHAERFDLAWFDKPLLLRPRTIDALRRHGTLTVHYTLDNPFGGRRRSFWRLTARCFPHYDACLVPRPTQVDGYAAAGARRVLVMPLAYEPTIHYPPPPGWSDADRTHGVTFIGAPWDDRRAFLLRLRREYGIAVHVRGPHWAQVLSPDERRVLRPEGPVWDGDYREALWRSRICLGFVTYLNADTEAHRSFEIAACGAFLLAERTAEHERLFAPGEEAAFFTGVDQCAAQIRRYLDDEPARARIAAAGQRRAAQSGYSNDARLRRALDALFGAGERRLAPADAA